MAGDPSILFNRLLARGRLRHLQLLVALADAGSVQRAAQAVGMSQPAATQALSDLEALLGATLFERHNRGVRLGRYGEAVVPVARNVLDALRASTETLSALQAGAQALLRLGAIPAASSGLLAACLPEWLSTQAGLQIELIEESTAHLLPELATGRLDAVLCRKPADLPAAWRFEPLLPDAPVLVAAPGHSLAGRRRLRLPELARTTWILPPAGMGVRDVHERLWADQAARPALYPLATTALSVVQEVMRASGALCLMPASMARSLIDAGVAVALDWTPPEHLRDSLEGIGLLTTGRADSRTLGKLRQFLRAQAR